MKKAIYYGSICAKWSHKERMQFAAEVGLDGVEIPQVGSRQEAEEIAAAAQEAGIEIHSVMAGTHWQLPLSSTDEEVREKGVAGIKDALHVAKWAGADTVLVVPGVVTENVSYAAAYELSKKSLYEILPTAEELGIVMALENVWNKFLLSPIEFREFVDGFESELVRAYFDVGNILLYGYPHQWIDALGERIVKVHVKDFDVNTRQFVALLTGSVDYPRVVNALRGVGYDGYLTAELAVYAQYPEQFVRDTAEHLARIIES